MPSQRKRIGFLPRAEVQNIIDKICKHNKLSQSRVTGMLVEEALSSRGVLKLSKSNAALNFESFNDNSILIPNNSKINNSEEKFVLEDSSFNEEVQMINDFVEFKFFKNIMNKKKIKQK